ncbi:Chromosome partition protein Smc [Caloramator mitchellensis]|uniref:Chromosome partition protein Smc n=1 Tax=Caloramator mitchellensis TaxID=908809 RepID=A0A0R3JV51_CALMK|nr:chromosome segregation protein SMC [Caloramator mitchellensis]KRQ86954.1 Chromosome partition protein Smc [Caloramator mitchellensis]
MQLKSVEIKGFKSFADKVDLDFTHGITAIVGPNGSGKSNIVDAIRWVLGEQSAKTLRGAKMEDVIFAGTENRKQLNYAEVSLILDNGDGLLPIEYNEVKITRRLYRSGESEYMLNNSICRLKDIYELLMDTGIGVDGYSIIGQGKVEEILSSKAEDRRSIFEEATGITKFKSRKIEAEKKLENTRQNLIRINDIISELESQISPLELQAKKAEKYLEYKKDLMNLEINSILYNYDIIKQKLDITSIEIEKKVREKENIMEEIQTFTEQIEKQKKALNIILREYDETYNLNFEIDKNIQRKTAELNLIIERKENATNDKYRLNGDVENLRKYIELEEQKKIKLISEKNYIQGKLKRQEEKIKEYENELNNYYKEYKKHEQSIEDKKNDILEVLKNLSETKNKISSLLFIEENITKQLNNLHLINKSKIDKKNELEQIYNQKTNERNIINKSINIYNQSINAAQNNLKEIETKINKFIIDKNKIFQNMKTNEARLNMLLEMEKEHEGYNKAVKSIIEKYNKNSGFIGTVADIIDVPEGYETAIEAALGNAVQNIVVENEHYAKEMIEYLKRNKTGRATFLPLTTVKARDVLREDDFKKFNGFIGIASGVVNFNSKYSNVVSNLLGRTLICNDIDNAINLAQKTDFSFRIVTLDGEIINIGGSLTGGSSYKNIGIFKRKNDIIEIEKKLNIEKEKIKQLDFEIEKNEFEKKNAILEIEDLKSKINNAYIQDNNFNNLLADIKNKIHDLNNEIEASNVEIEHLTNELSKIENDKNTYSIEIERNSLLEKQKNNELIELNEALKNFEKMKDDINNKLTNEKIIFAEKKKELDSLEEKITEVESLIERSKLKIEEYSKEILFIENRILEFDNEISKTKDEIFKLTLDFKNGKEKENELLIKKNQIIDTTGKIEEQLNKKNRELSDIIGIVHKLEMTQAKQESEIELLNQRLWDEYEMSIPQALKYKVSEFNNLESTKKINEFKSKIKELGEVNIGSIEELKKVKERYTFLKVQRDDLENAEKSLIEVIDEITNKMKVQFEANFAIIKKYFNETFKELFGGGHADLKIDGENILESGIEIIVQPPGKKLQSISLLSGGEKGLSAIALIFALLKFKPTPFCVLDEIEAALDDANVLRFANYLKHYSHKTQFVLITHRKGSMGAADALYGVTMEEKGVSKLVSLKLKEAI